VASAVQSAQVQGFKQTGVVERKMWNTSLDASVRDSHEIEGQTVGLDDLFTLSNGAQARAPADASLGAGDRINCRCFVNPVFIDEEVENPQGLSFSESGVVPAGLDPVSNTIL
jgi:uncharacterized protein with gpF-like domain